MDMKWIERFFKGMQVFLLSVAGLILIDMLILGGKIKLIILALGNTSDYSPFSSDGQMNWILLLVIGIMILMIYIFLKVVRGGPPDE